MTPVAIVHPDGRLYAGSESFHPNLADAASCIGDTFHYQVCTEDPIETPDETDMRDVIAEWIYEQTGMLEMDPALRALDRCAGVVAGLAKMLADGPETVWTPTGPVLQFDPESDMP